MPRAKPQRSLHKDTSLINRKLPVEILTMILFTLGPSSFQNPYVYLPLCWICRRWRSIVLNTPKFWTVINHECKRYGSHEFIREVIFRSKSREVDVNLRSLNCHKSSLPCNNCSHITSSILYFKHSQIRTLFLYDHSDFDFSNGENIAQLDNLILSKIPALSDSQQKSFDKFLSAVNPRFIELSQPLLSKQMSQNLSLDRLEWLKLTLSHFGNISAVSPFLEALPGLRILNLISDEDSIFPPEARAIANLPNLRILTLDPHAGDLCSIKTSALNHLGISSATSGFYRWDYLSTIDFSMTKSIRIALCHVQPDPSSVACISTGHSEEDCDFFHHFHAPIAQSNKSMDHHWTLPSSNSFHISFKWSWYNYSLFSQLKQRATNIVELMVDFRSMKSSDWEDREDQQMYHEFLGKILDNFDTVTHISVLRSRSFASVCDLLMVGWRLPYLERLTYHSSHKPGCSPKIVSKRMEMVRDARVEAHSEPLKILELKSFVIVPPKQVEELEKLGIRLIQTN